jgi:hypothetical protein
MASDFENFVPDMQDRLVAADNFKSVLAGVAGARDEDAVIFKLETRRSGFSSNRSRR